VAEWLGQLISDWPSWATILVVIDVVIVGALWILLFNADGAEPIFRKRRYLGEKRGKK